MIQDASRLPPACAAGHEPQRTTLQYGANMNEQKFFPQNKREALAYLFVQSQDLSGLSPTAILDLYNNALDEIAAAERAKKDLRSQRKDTEY